MSRKSKRKKGSRGRSGRFLKKSLFLLLFAVGALWVYGERVDFYAGIRALFAGRAEVRVVRSEAGLPAARAAVSPAVRVAGIPDYASFVRFPDDGGMLTCFRMTGFQNRLLICTGKKLAKPDEIAEIIRERSFGGRLLPFSESQYGEKIQRSLERTHGIKVPDGAWLLEEGRSHLPSTGKTLALAGCAVLSFLFLIRIIIG